MSRTSNTVFSQPQFSQPQQSSASLHPFTMAEQVSSTPKQLAGLILLVSDDRLLQSMLHQSAIKDNYRLVGVHSTDAAMSEYQILQPDLVLIDAEMKHLEGFTCCQFVSQAAKCWSTPIMMLAGSDEPKIIHQIFEAGASDYIAKPIHWIVLRHRVQHLIRSYQTSQRLQQINIDLQKELHICTNNLQEKIQEVEHLNQTKDDFLNLVSHELRSPLSNMRVSIQMLAGLVNRGREICGETAIRNTNCTKTLKYLQILQNECEREIDLVNDLLDLQRLYANSQPQCVEIIVLKEWIANLTAPFSDRASQRQQTLYAYLESSLPSATIDPTSLARIITELLHNACKYTPPQGAIVLTAKVVDQTLCLQVSNSGVEIPECERDRIFDRFYRIPGGDPWQQGGTGLGLSLIQHLIHHLQRLSLE